MSYFNDDESHEKLLKKVRQAAAQPDPIKHLKASLIKSGIRIIGYLFLLPLGGFAVAASFILVISEVVGIVEELV